MIENPKNHEQLFATENTEVTEKGKI